MNNPWDENGPDHANANKQNRISRHFSSYRLFFWLLAIVVLASVLYYLSEQFPGSVDDDEKLPRLVYLVALLILVGAGFPSRRLNFRKSIKQFIIWGSIFLLLAGVYALRHDFAYIGNNILGELLPGRGIETAQRSVAYRAGRDGHYHVDALIDGKPIRFMVDTGASLIVLSPGDARRLGFDPKDLKFDRIMNTANGRVNGASIKISQLLIGPIEVRDITAIVNGAELSQSLLGMNFLERLDSFEFKDNRLTMHGRGP